MTRQRIGDADVIYEFTPGLEPSATVESDTKLTVETRDSLEGSIQTDDDRLDGVPREVNGATGPIAVEGAGPGDVLAVEIREIRPVEDRGRVITIPDFGLLQDDPAVEAPSTTVMPIEGDSLSFDGIEVPIEPLIGTIGVAPEGESYTTLVPHDHGGNLDTTDLCAGSTVYFPVFQEGAMLAMGDCKAAMADGEMCGTGAEIATEIDCTLSVISDPPTPLRRPLIETDGAWKTLASAETMEEACALANRDAMELLETEHGFSTTEAHLFSSLVCDLEISQVVDPLVTVRNAVPKEYLDTPF